MPRFVEASRRGRRRAVKNTHRDREGLRGAALCISPGRQFPVTSLEFGVESLLLRLMLFDEAGLYDYTRVEKKAVEVPMTIGAVGAS